MNIDNIKIAQALAYQLERVDSDIEMITGEVSYIKIATSDHYSYSLLSCDNEESVELIRGIMVSHLLETRDKIIKEIKELN